VSAPNLSTQLAAFATEQPTRPRVDDLSEHAHQATQGNSGMDHSKHIRLTETELNAATLDDVTVYGADDAKIGKVSHVHGMGMSGDVIVDVGGFLGLGTKPVSLKINQLDFMRDEHGHVHATTTWTKAQVEEQPQHMHS
jgi:hypothetical protein